MSKMRILIVDDEKELVGLIACRLESAGYEVLSAGDGHSGLEMARREKPDLVILDIMLPKIDGFKVCRLLKFDRKYQSIPILLFSARAFEETADIGRQVKMDAYLTKPFDSGVLLAKVKELIGQ